MSAAGDPRFPIPGGLPTSYRFVGLAYSPPTKRLIATVSTGASSDVRFRIFSRPADASVYQELPYPTDVDLSHRSAVVSSGTPFVFLNQWRADKGGFDWVAILRCDLRGWRIKPVLTRERLGKLVTAGRWWIADLVGANADGEQLFCTVGKQLEGSAGSPVSYELCTLDLKAESLSAHTVLEGTFL